MHNKDNKDNIKGIYDDLKIAYYPKNLKGRLTAKDIFKNALTHKEEADDYFKRSAFNFWSNNNLSWDARAYRGLRGVYDSFINPALDGVQQIAGMSECLKNTILNDTVAVGIIEQVLNGEEPEYVEESENFLKSLDFLSGFMERIDALGIYKEALNNGQKVKKLNTKPMLGVTEKAVGMINDIDEYINFHLEEDYRKQAPTPRGFDRAFDDMPGGFMNGQDDFTKYMLAVTEIRRSITILNDILELLDDIGEYASDEE